MSREASPSMAASVELNNGSGEVLERVSLRDARAQFAFSVSRIVSIKYRFSGLRMEKSNILFNLRTSRQIGGAGGVHRYQIYS